MSVFAWKQLFDLLNKAKLSLIGWSVLTLKNFIYTQRFTVSVKWVTKKWVNTVDTRVFASFSCLVPKVVELFPLPTCKCVPRNRSVWLGCISAFETCCREAEKVLFLPWLRDDYFKNCSVKRVYSVWEDERHWGKCWSVSAGNKQQTLVWVSSEELYCLPFTGPGFKVRNIGLPSWAHFMVGPE